MGPIKILSYLQRWINGVDANHRCDIMKWFHGTKTNLALRTVPTNTEVFLRGL